MGLFSSKTKTTVGTAVARVIPDESLPDSIKNGVIKSIFEDGDLSEHVVEALTGSIGVRAERMYEYGKRAYAHGLPSGQMVSSAIGRAEVEAVLATLEGNTVLLDYLHYGPANNLHIGWMNLVSSRGYNTSTNELPPLSDSKGTTVWLHDMVVVVPEAKFPTMSQDSLAQWGQAPRAGITHERAIGTEASRGLILHSPVETSSIRPDEFLRVTYTWYLPVKDTDPNTWKNYAEFDIPVVGYPNDAEYLHVKYKVGGVIKYWMYRIGSGIHPTLDALVDAAPEVNGTFFPFAYFRYNKKSEIEDKSTAAYKTSKKLVKYLGMDYDDIAAAIDENPDIANVEQAMLMMAVPVNTEDQQELWYLYEFFENMFFANGGGAMTRDTAVIFAGLRGEILTQTNLVIQDSRFKMGIRHSGIYRARVGGTIGAVGSHARGMETVYTESSSVNHETGATQIELIPHKYHYFRRQVTEHLYEEIQVVGLQTLFYVFESFASIGDEEDDILLIPLDRSITEKLTIPQREVLYARSLHYVFNSKVVTKVKWYQQSWFKAVLIIVAIAITIWSWGSSGGLLSTLKAAAIMGGAELVAVTLITAVVKMAVVTVGVQLFIKAAGAELAFLVALIAAAYGMYQSFATGAPWATDLVNLSNSLTKGIGTYMQGQMDDLLQSASDFSKYIEEQTKLLDTAKELLEGNNLLSPFVIFGESPDDYYNRTVHSGNIGVIGFEAVSSYVEVALTLPKLDETVGENFYV